jgi:hypothetical protein
MKFKKMYIYIYKMSAVVLKIFSAGVLYALINLGYANNVNEAFQLKNEKIGQVANPEIVAACTSLMPVFDSKGTGTFTFTCDKDPVAAPPVKEIKTGGRRKSRRNRKSRKSRK